MATEGLRRSTRVSKPVKSYADEAEEDELAWSKAPPKSKPKGKNKIPISIPIPEDKESEKTEDAEDEDFALSEPSPKRKRKGTDVPQHQKDARTAKILGNGDKHAIAYKQHVAAKRSDKAWHGVAAERRIGANKRKIEKLKPGEQETRLRSYVTQPPKSYYEFVNRANTQRMFVLDRERGVEDDCHANHSDCPYESVELAGSKGNVYTVTISHMPSCTCPVGIFTKTGEEKLCKHVLYVLHHVLKAPDHLKKQSAFLTSELKEIFSNAPALPVEVAEDEAKDGNRKPMEDDCPICCMEFEEDEEVVWCRAACGNNIHRACFEQWARTKASRVTCPFCRTEWPYGQAPKSQKVNVATVNIPTVRGADGYRNVREQLDYD